MANTKTDLTAQVSSLQSKIERLQALLDNALRFVFLAGPALQNLLGTLGPATPTSDYDGVQFANTELTVTIIPAKEKIIIDGIGTGHHREYIATGGQLDSKQIESIVAVHAAIKAVRGKKADPLVDGLDLVGTPLALATV